MANVRVILILVLPILLACIVGAIILQIFLSKKENKWYGLILPIITFVLSLIWPLNMAAPSAGITAGFVAQMLIIWLIANIPTIILAVIYLACRENVRKKNRLDKMNIQDLG